MGDDNDRYSCDVEASRASLEADRHARSLLSKDTK